MKIIILAAGKGTRMNNLTDDIPKPLLTYEGKTLLEHKFDILPSSTTEIILVIGYLRDTIRDYFGDSYNSIPIRYVVQNEMRGTADALWHCQDFLEGHFMVLMGDDLYNKNDLLRISSIASDEWSVLVSPDTTGIKVGSMVKDSEDNLEQIYNGPEGVSLYNNTYTGACVLTPEVFTKPMFELSSGEFGLPQSFTQFAEEKAIKVFETDSWTRITSPEDLK